MITPMKNYVQVELISADISAVMDELSGSGIILWDIEFPKPLTAVFKVAVLDLSSVQAVVIRRGDSCNIYNKKGIIWRVLKLRKRYIFLIGVAMILFLTWWLPTKVLFFEVNGCSKELKYAVIDIASVEGVYFGSNTSDVQSNKLKNSIISKLPGVEWAGVTIRGCVAVIDVQQGSVAEKEETDSKIVSHIVAVTDGIIESVTTEKGVSYCAPGQAVRQGQILISGFEDCGFTIKAIRASGEVVAYTRRNLKAVTPLKTEYRTEYVDHKTDYSFIIGKKQINLYNYSGISDGSCVKMYSRKYVSLPGGYQLPIALVKEDYYRYDSVSETQSETNFEFLEAQSKDYILLQMRAGEILVEDGIYDFTSDSAIYSATYACREQIGIPKNEETLVNDRFYQ